MVPDQSSTINGLSKSQSTNQHYKHTSDKNNKLFQKNNVNYNCKKWESLDIQGKSENCMYLFLCEDYFILNRWRKRTREREKKKKRVFLVIFEKYLFEKLVLKQ